MSDTVIILLSVAVIALCSEWRRSISRRIKLDADLAKKSADYEILNQQCADRGIELFNYRNDANRLAALLRTHIADMDKVATLLGGKDDGKVMAVEREALRLHDELNTPKSNE